MSRRQIFSLFFAFLILLGGGTILVLRETGAAKGLVHDLLSKVVRGDLLRLDDAQFDLTSGRMTINRLEIKDPTSQAADQPILAVDKMEVDVETNPLGEVGTVRRVKIDGLELNLDLSRGEVPDLGGFLQQAGVPEDGTADHSLPALEVENSKVNIRFAPGQPAVPFHNLHLQILPLAAEPERMQLTGTMVSPLGATARITGAGQPKTGECRILVIMESVPLRPQQAEAFHAGAAALLRDHRLQGMASKATIWFERSIDNSQAGAFLTQGGITADLRDLQIQPPAFPYPLEHVHGRVVAQLGGNGNLKFELHKTSADADLHAHGEVREAFSASPKIDIEAKLSDLLLGEAFVTALQQAQSPLVRELDTGLRPRGGRMDVQLRLHNRRGPLHLVADVEFKGVEAAYHGFEDEGERLGFPYPLRDVRGKLRLEPQRLILSSLQAKDQDGKEVRVEGEVRYQDGTAYPQLRIHGDDIAFSPRVRKALGALLPDGPAIYDEYAPQGLCDIEVRIDHSVAARRFSVELRPEAASSAYAGFPYRIAGLRGSVHIADAGVKVDLRGGNQPEQPISIHGRFLFGADVDSRLRSELWIKAQQLPFDERLKQACAVVDASIPEFWDFARPRGAVDAEVTLWSEADSSTTRYDIHLGLKDCSMSGRGFPLPIEQVRGDVFLHGTDDQLRCDISPLQGRIDNGRGKTPARVLVQGSVHKSATGLQTDVTSIVQDLQLTADAGQALDASGIFAKPLWDRLALGGQIDVTAHHRQPPGETALQQRFLVRLRDVSSRATFLPGVAEGMRGEIVVENGQARVQKIRGRIGGTAVLFDRGLLAVQNGAAHLDCRISAADFPIDDRLAALLDGSGKQAFLASRWRGRADLNGLELGLEFPLAGGPMRVRCAGALKVRDLSFDCGLPEPQGIRHLSGILQVREAGWSADGVKLDGRLVGGALQLAGMQAHGIQARVQLQQGELRLYDLDCNLSGGKLRAAGPGQIALYYRLGTDSRMMAWLRFHDMSLASLLRGRGLNHSKVRGDLAGELIIEELAGRDFLNMKAHGEVLVGNGRLGTVPIFAAIYSHLKPANRPQFTAGKAAFKISDQLIEFTELNARSDLFKVEGTGSLSMDGFMDIRLNIPKVFGSAASILILPPLINKVVSELVSFQVYGNIRSPKAQPLWLGTSPQRRPSLLPIPPVDR